MIKAFIFLRKIFYVKPKWKILRIYTKTISRKKIELLQRALLTELHSSVDVEEAAFLRGKLEIINLLLK
jgi:hypothetical protein